MDYPSPPGRVAQAIACLSAELCRRVWSQPGPAHPGGHAPARRLHRRPRLRHSLFSASDRRFRRGALGLIGAGHIPGGGLRHRHSRLHGLVRSRLCLDRLRSDVARGAAADCPEWRAICARGGIPLRPRSGQRIRREYRAAWRGEGRTATSRGRACGCRGYHAADILLARPPHLDHIGHWLAVARRSDTRGRAGLFQRQPYPRRPDYGGGRLHPGAGAMRWFVDNFSRLADWRAAVHRVARFREALDNLPAVEEGAQEIKRTLHPDGHLAFESVRILLPDGHIVIEDATVSIAPGERVLIVGETGRGKSTLFRAVAGLWPWGSGTILTPAPGAMAFLPQRPYLPLGTLRNALSLSLIHISEPTRRTPISYAVFCLKTKKHIPTIQ